MNNLAIRSLLCAAIAMAAISSCNNGNGNKNNTTANMTAAASSSTANDEQSIRDMYDKWGKAMQAKDINGIMTIYDSSVVAFDAFPPREYNGKAAYQKDYEGFLAAFPGPLKENIPEMKVSVSGDIAYVFGADHWTVTAQDNKSIEMVFRFTDVLQKENGQWKIVHEHLSFPVDATTGMVDWMSK